MKLFSLFFIFLTSIALVSCTSEDMLSLSESEPTHDITSNRVSLSDALQKADKIFTSLAERYSETISSVPRTPSSISYINFYGNTRSATNGIDTLLYVVNYGDGFAILSADKRCRAVYAISESGKLNIEDTVYNPGLKMALENIKTDAIKRVNNDCFPIDTVIQRPDTTDVGNYPLIRSVKPHLSVCQANWGQKEPFNKYIPGEPYSAVGCVALATAQVMSFYKYPYVYNEHSYYWEDICNNNSSNSLALLLSDLGRPENLDMDYSSDPGIASSHMYLVPNTMINMGYKSVGGLKPMNPSKLKKALRTTPVIMEGSQWLIDGKVYGGHCWVIDGYMEILADPITGEYDPPLFHCVWGWYGNNNGFFFWDNQFDAYEPQIPDDDNKWGGFDKVYKINVNYIDEFETGL